MNRWQKICFSIDVYVVSVIRHSLKWMLDKCSRVLKRSFPFPANNEKKNSYIVSNTDRINSMIACICLDRSTANQRVCRNKEAHNCCCPGAAVFPYMNMDKWQQRQQKSFWYSSPLRMVLRRLPYALCYCVYLWIRIQSIWQNVWENPVKFNYYI